MRNKERVLWSAVCATLLTVMLLHKCPTPQQYQEQIDWLKQKPLYEAAVLESYGHALQGIETNEMNQVMGEALIKMAEVLRKEHAERLLKMAR